MSENEQEQQQPAPTASAQVPAPAETPAPTETTSEEKSRIPDIGIKPDQIVTDSSVFPAVGIVFFVVGLFLFAAEATRAVGLPFLALGIVFFVIGRRKSSGGWK